MPNKLTQKQVINEFIKKHNYYYKYDKFIYKNAKTLGIIICPNHGDFEQTSDSHKRGSGCPKCSKLKVIKMHRKNLSYGKNGFITKSNKIFNFYYDYSKVNYTNCKNKVIIICPKHGEFKIIPEKHYRDGIGCSDCSVSSKGEVKITHILNKYKIIFTRQKYYNFLDTKMFYDFYLENYDIHIEFDGKQHFKNYCYGDKFINHSKDLFKNMYIAHTKNTLLRIHYLDINKMEKIILDFINKDKRNNIFYSRHKYYKDFNFCETP